MPPSFKYTQAILIIILGLLSQQAIAQTTLQGKFKEAEGRSPNTYEFKKNDLVIQTDPMLYYGFQYTSYYEIEYVNDSLFHLLFYRQEIKNNNPLKPRRRSRKIKNGYSVELVTDQYESWSFFKREDGTYILTGSTPDPQRKRVLELVPVGN